MNAASPSNPPSERRTAPRFQPAFGTVFRFPLPGGSSVVGLVWNVSESGISMLLAEPPQRGAELRGELGAEGGGPGLAVALRVVHVRELPTGDHFLGAQFLRPLNPGELAPFLAAPLPTSRPGEVKG
jgi:hypothetical protein